MAKHLPVSRSQRAYMERKLACVDQARAHPPSAADLARLLAEMQTPDEYVRARAVRQVCPCHVPWEVFQQVRKMAKCLQHDPSPLVRANARHVEEDARELSALEALRERLAERDEAGAAASHQSQRSGRHRKGHHAAPRRGLYER